MLEALLWAGREAALSHRCAAGRWHLDPIDGPPIELTSPLALRRVPPGIVVHRGELDASDVGRLGCLRTTSPARTIVDLAGVVEDETLEIALDCALAKRHVSVERIEMTLHRMGSRGRKGSASLGRLLSARSDGRPLGMSPLEVRFLRLLRRARVDLPQSQYEMNLEGRKVVVDYAYPNEKVAIELDGYRWHSSPKRLVSDRHKGNLFVLEGWKLLRFTDPDLRHEPRRIVDAILRARGHNQLMI